MYRKFIITSLAALAVAATLSFAPAPAAAYDRTQGGVIPGSRDAYHFVYGKGWVPNQRSHRRGHMGNAHRRPMMGQRHGNVRQTGHWQAKKKFRQSTTTTVRTSRHLRYRGRIVVPATAATAGYLVGRQHPGHGHVAPQPVFRAPEARGVSMVYERSTTGECSFGFRFIGATGECI